MIQDSGQRREFATGAVRDIQEGKGRCDLLPLAEVAQLLSEVQYASASMMFSHIARFVMYGDASYLFMALSELSDTAFKGKADMLLEVAVHFEEGAKKYGENNWQKGLPVSCYVDSAIRHYLKYMRGDTDERHDRACAWNLLCCIWTCDNKPELNTYGQKEGPENDR